MYFVTSRSALRDDVICGDVTALSCTVFDRLPVLVCCGNVALPNFRTRRPTRQIRLRWGKPYDPLSSTGTQGVTAATLRP